MGEPARILGRFELVERVGAGTLTLVYRARTLRGVAGIGRSRLAAGSEVAIKLLRSSFARDEAAVARFHREAEKLGELQHPRVLPVLAIGESGGIPWFATPYLPGGNLAERLDAWRGKAKRGETAASATDTLDRRTPFAPGDRAVADPPHAERIEWLLDRFEETLEGLAFLHERGVLHRDLKPGNLFLDAKGSCVLGDFGLARGLADRQLTLAGELLGTPAYMAPEVVTRQRVPGQASDLWSLAASFFELMSLEPPVVGRSAETVLAGESGGAAIALDSVVQGVGPELTSFFDRCLATEPRLRFASAADALAALRRLRDSGVPPPRARLGTRISVTLHRLRVPAFVLCGLLTVVLGWVAIESLRAAGGPAREAARILALVRRSFDFSGAGIERRLYELARARELDPRSWEIELARARVLIEARRFEIAWVAVERARERGARGPQLWAIELAVADHLPEGARADPALRARLDETRRSLTRSGPPVDAQAAFLRALVHVSTREARKALALIEPFKTDGQHAGVFMRIEVIALDALGRGREAFDVGQLYASLPGAEVGSEFLAMQVRRASRLGLRVAAADLLERLRSITGSEDARYVAAHASYLVRFPEAEAWIERVDEVLERAKQLGTSVLVSLQLRASRLELGRVVDAETERVALCAAARALGESRSGDFGTQCVAAKILWGLGCIEDAERFFETAQKLATFPAERVKLLTLRGRLALQGKPADHARAVEYFERALELEPERTALKYSLASSLFLREGRQEDATVSAKSVATELRLLREVVEGDPSHLAAKRLRARILVRVSDDAYVQRGVQAYEQLLRAGSLNSDDLIGLGVGYHRLRMFERMIETAESGAKREAESPDPDASKLAILRTNVALGLFSKGEIDGARDAIRRVLAIRGARQPPKLLVLQYRVHDHDLSDAADEATEASLRDKMKRLAQRLQGLGQKSHLLQLHKACKVSPFKALGIPVPKARASSAQEGQ